MRDGERERPKEPAAAEKRSSAGVRVSGTRSRSSTRRPATLTVHEHSAFLHARLDENVGGRDAAQQIGVVLVSQVHREVGEEVRECRREPCYIDDVRDVAALQPLPARERKASRFRLGPGLDRCTADEARQTATQQPWRCDGQAHTEILFSKTIPGSCYQEECPKTVNKESSDQDRTRGIKTK